ncbi:MAG TPA: phage integrase N-terminal SAM-like domain-containing protein [Burkholderiaceae bacterium]|nr:phage integrase N-terminal SAM-like domain-containing protein [Burkholderiaceae bacterium]
MAEARPRLLDEVRDIIRVEDYGIRTGECYVDWIRRFILFHNRQHPATLNATDVGAFLTHLAAAGKGAYRR